MLHSEGEPSLDWRSANLTRSQKGRIPSEPGLYVIKRVIRVLGLPMPKSIEYVGRTKNLKRRFLEHINPITEHNQRLLEMAWSNKLEFWFAKAPVEELVELEKTLIQRLQPATNIIDNKGKKHDQK